MRTLTELISTAAAELFPGYFAITMATGAVSIAAHILGLTVVSYALLAVNLVVYAALAALSLLRALRYHRRLWADMNSHARGPGFFTLVAGTCVLGTQLLLLTGAAELSRLLWWFAIALWATVTYAFFVAVTTREHKPTLETGINGAWLLAVVACQSISVLGASLPWSDTAQKPILFFALCMFVLGCMLYLAIIPLIFYRLTFVRVTVRSLTPPYWINMGAAAISTLAGCTLILAADHSPLLLEVRPFLKGFTLLFWSAASWWIPLLLGLTLWRHFLRRHPLAYDPQFWSMVFPLGMYTTCTLRLSQVFQLQVLWLVAWGFLGVALVTWVVTAMGFLRKIHSVAVGEAPTRARAMADPVGAAGRQEPHDPP
jgi:tellurite resistance protein TehA-like permease